MNWKRGLRWAGVILLAPVILLLAIQFTAPLWLDQNAVKRQVESIIAKATGGNAQYARIDLRFLPWPSAVVSAVRFSLPGTVELEAQTAEIDIRLLPLFAGRVELRRLHITSPVVKLHLARAVPDTQPAATPFSLKTVDAKLRATLGELEQRAPGFAATIEDGHFVIDAAGRPPLTLAHVDVSADVTSDAITASVSLSTPWVKRISARVRVSPSDLAGNADVQITALDGRALGAALSAGDSWPVDTAVVTLRLGLTMRGLSDAQLTLAVTSPQLALRFGQGRLGLRGLDLDVAAHTTNGAAEVRLEKFAIATPRLNANATLTWSETGELSLNAQAGDLDLPTLQAAAKPLAPAAPWLDSFPVSITNGTLSHGTLAASAHTFGDLFALPAMRITGELDDAAVTVTALNNVAVTGVNALVSLDGGRLHAERIAIALGKTTAQDGTFDMDLNPKVPTLGADIIATADLAEGFAIAGRILGADSAKTLGAITHLEGSAAARVSIRGNVDTVIPRVDFSQLRASARYAAIPFPVRISGGGGSYTTHAIEIQALSGAIGLSTFAGVDARVGLDSPMVVTARGGRVHAALEEIFHWARTQPKLAKQLDSVSAVTGALVITIGQLSLPVRTPVKLTFRASATPERVMVDAPRFGPRATLDGGTIEVTEQDVNVVRVGLSVLDARLIVLARVPGYRDTVRQVMGGVSGPVGPQAIAWVWARAALPPSLRLRSALQLAGVAAEWERAGGVAARGYLEVIDGPSIDFAMRSDSDHLEIEKVMIRDGASNVTVAASLEGEKFKAEYQGKLAGSTLDHIFVEPPLRIGELEGTLRANGNFKHSRSTHATGTLTGTQIVLPPTLPVPLTIDRLSLEAKDSVLELHYAALTSGESRATLSGSMSFVGDKYHVDVDVHGDTVIVPEVSAADSSAVHDSAHAAARAPTRAERQTRLMRAIRDIPVEGAARVNIMLLRLGRFDVAPLNATAAIEPHRIAATLMNTRLCGIAASGGASFTADTFDLSAAMSVHDAPIAGSVACLSGQRVQLTGTVSVASQISSHGPPGTLLEHMRGSFALTARNGRIARFEQLASILKVVNATQVLVGQAADLEKGGMAYSLMKVEMDIEGSRFDVKQATLDATGLDVGAHGTVDLVGRTLDFDVLVAPIKTASWIVSHTPIIRNIFGGSILAIPVHVGGTIEKPRIVPLGAQAVGSRLLDILGNTVSLPKELIKVTPADSVKQK